MIISVFFVLAVVATLPVLFASVCTPLYTRKFNTNLDSLVGIPRRKLEPPLESHLIRTSLLRVIFQFHRSDGRNILHVLLELETLPGLGRSECCWIGRFPLWKQSFERSAEPKTSW